MFSLLELRFLGADSILKSRFINAQNLKENDITKMVIENLHNYLNGETPKYDVPLKPCGADFFKRVWVSVQGIPYGQTRSYKDIAKSISYPKASRAVGVANHKNPILIFIPCHRVIGSNNKLTGYACGLELKTKLLEIEGVKVDKKNLSVESIESNLPKLAFKGIK
ncbi:methylated-DNA--[protein]-cysteine S-methyltransferase [Helicobacter saguini]|uniref:methylated-DNA--[protein]-cysteine S-methyltransferase n=2 Tax=Helicobacter saguini TaxID=1548018 RepID=A0A347VU35_9HELI|nr:methylated-DNA--[protein]-cysteine S-methyltransferase [Helicobacter saguini]MWV66158.1 methylated-DNA--[protein]-cysteine S-methyltransferase [Helicobacter saguini]MWV68507.1 methylated-DNA--[protein]-cysteine S-methyltransferase [Helicobacter saguini]MWV71938.1 methylated-DNA--[protein]-cysteine S-methyltransferase [Helicobacter saguini]TLD96004.1 methylated-DNA--[protein]-cysteine S-methyltransferase [Helicobacter saguini]